MEKEARVRREDSRKNKFFWASRPENKE
jgi:hypothetical protein